MRKVAARIRREFIAGVLVTVPVIVTVLALRFLFQGLDDLLGPWISRAIGREIPGVGVAATLILVLLVGVIASNYLGKKIVSIGEKLFGSLPFVRTIYVASREIVEAITLPKHRIFKDIVMLEYPRKGLFSYGFVTSYTNRHGPRGPVRLANVYVPTPPLPTGGALVACPVEELLLLDISGEEAMKLIVSAGLIIPDELRGRTLEAPQRPAPRP